MQSTTRPHVRNGVSGMFDDLLWHADRMLLGDLVFRLQHYKSEDWELGDECFLFFKIKHLVDQYQRFWSEYRGPQPQTILELGMFDGGSLAFWNEIFQPQKIVGVDIKQRQDSSYFRRYVESRGLQDRVKTYWSTDQTDEAALQRIVQDEFGGRVDLVIDDCSHLYPQSKASFEILYPKLNHPGLYLIEDWAWGHWQEFQQDSSSWSRQTALTKLVFELVEAIGSSRPETGSWLLSSLRVQQGFVAVETGSTELEAGRRLKIEDHILRGSSVSQFFIEPPSSPSNGLWSRLRKLLKR